MEQICVPKCLDDSLFGDDGGDDLFGDAPAPSVEKITKPTKGTIVLGSRNTIEYFFLPTSHLQHDLPLHLFAGIMTHLGHDTLKHHVIAAKVKSENVSSLFGDLGGDDYGLFGGGSDPFADSFEQLSGAKFSFFLFAVPRGIFASCVLLYWYLPLCEAENRSLFFWQPNVGGDSKSKAKPEDKKINLKSNATSDGLFGDVDDGGLFGAGGDDLFG